MTKYFLAAIAILLPIVHNTAQTPESSTLLQGIVFGENNEVLAGASVYWQNTNIGATTDTDGWFSLPVQTAPSFLMVQYVGYQSVAVKIQPDERIVRIIITPDGLLKELTVTEHQFDNRISALQPLNIESINKKELRKAPCCNLSESFETNNSVDVVYANAVTGVKEIQMLGLRGVYSQFLLENRPTLGGIATPFAFEMIPGPWLEGIQLAKGAATVKNGNAGISGQINAELLKPHLEKPLFINAFGSSEGRGELNINLNKKGKKNWSNGLLTHGSFVKNRWDMNGDNFYDMPNRHQLNALYRGWYESDKMCGQINVQAITDRRLGGQIRENAQGTFTVDQRNERIEVWGKLGRENLFGKPYNQLGNMLGASWHRFDGLYGANQYAATQQSVYWQTLVQTIIGTTDHQIVLAPSIQYDNIAETVNETNLDRRETLAGAMLEYTYSRPNLRLEMPDLVVVAGARMDWNSRFGWQLTPRASAKYHFQKETVLRLSAGRGFRSPNLMAENISILASNRQLLFADNIRNEEAWNYGLNFTHDTRLGGRAFVFSVDLYRTDFVRQILVDVDQSPLSVSFYQVNGKSFSNSALATLQYNLFSGLDLKFSYKWTDVQATFAGGQLRSLPLVARNRGLITIDYTTPNKRWMFNTNVQIVGPQRLPDNSDVPHSLVHEFPQTSPTYALFNAQITRTWDTFEWYLGGENLGNFQQHHAIIASENPQSPYFNGSQLWAPMSGVIVYMGIRAGI